MKLIRYFVLVAGLGIALAGCAFTSPNGTHVIYNPKGSATVPCITSSGCIGPDGVLYAWHEQVPTVASKFKLAAGLWRTPGTADGAAECHFARMGADGGTITDVHSDHGARYVQTAATDSEFRTSGCQPWVQYDGSEQPGGTPPRPCMPGGCFDRRSFQDGDYIVGHDAPEPATGDIAWGSVSLGDGAAPTDCRWQRMSADWTTVLASGDGNGDGISLFPDGVLIHEGEGIRLLDCGGMFWWSNS